MKKMTCSDLGGSCDAELHGETLEELSQDGWKHVKEAAESSDESHKELMAKMESQTEEEKTKWMEDMAPKFEAAEEA